jgi:hypothetical protein
MYTFGYRFSREMVAYSSDEGDLVFAWAAAEIRRLAIIALARFRFAYAGKIVSRPLGSILRRFLELRGVTKGASTLTSFAVVRAEHAASAARHRP